MGAVNRPGKYRREKRRARRLCQRTYRHRQPIQRRAQRRVHRIVGYERNVDEHLVDVARKYRGGLPCVGIGDKGVYARRGCSWLYL